MSLTIHSLVPKRSFPLGQICFTASALHALDHFDVYVALQRHAICDWGECDEEDFQSNDDALQGEDRLHSVYRDRSGTRFWIITEWDRSVTTILLPDDY